MVYWYIVPKAQDAEGGWGPSVQGNVGSVILPDGDYLIVNRTAINGLTPITDEQAQALLPEATYAQMVLNAGPQLHTINVTTAELGRISTGDFTLDVPVGNYVVDDWLTLIEVADGVPTGAKLSPLVIDAVNDNLDGTVELVFGMAIE